MNGIARGSNLVAEVHMVIETCCNCGMAFAMTKDFKQAKLDARGGRGETFYCPAGHSQHYLGETEEQKLRRERDRLKQNEAWYEQRAAELREEAAHERHRANGYKGHANKLRRRAKAGVCPCCTRHFDQLERHMAGKHPDFARELADAG